MTTKAQIMGGLEILAKYVDDADPCFMAAAHDQIWCAHSKDVSSDDAEKLKELGWFVSEDAWSRFV